jgi:predicted ATPase
LEDSLQPILREEDFAEALGRLLAETHTSVRRLEYLSGVSRRTLENWVHGHVKRPRNWEPILEIARALHLSAAEVDGLLLSAGQPSLASLQATDKSDRQADLLSSWRAKPATMPGQRSESTFVLNNLPSATTPFIGREEQLKELEALICRTDVRLVTVTGPGGVGKTRLAQEAAWRTSERFEHGVCFIALEAARTLDDLFDRMIAALGIRRDPVESAGEAILDFLRDKQLLLVLDTFENVLSEVEFIGDMIRFAPDIRVLATSRSVLRLSGEHVFPVPLMRSPKQITTMTDINKYEAVALFVSRVQAVNPGFSLTQNNVANVVEICRLLDGLPLALELAAARTRILSLQELRNQLAENPVLLADGPRDLPARQRSIQETIAWSYDLLNKDEQALFRRLSIFCEGCSLAAIQAVTSRELLDSGHFIDVLSSLLDQSLLHYRDISGQRFYRMHDLTRHYAGERLAEAGETDVAMTMLLNFICDLAERVDLHFRDKERAYWLGLLEPEANNVWTVLEWGIDVEDSPVISQCLSLCSVMRQYWGLQGQHDIARRWTERVIEAAQKENIAKGVQVGALLTAAAMALIQADVLTCADRAKSALAAAREGGDKGQQVRALHLLGLTTYSRNDLAKTAEIWEESLRLAEELGEKSLIALALDDLGNLAARREDYGRALSLHLREQTISQEAGDLYSEFYAVVNLGEVSMRLERPLEADMYNRRALELSREMGNPRTLVHTLCVQARLLRGLDRPAEARKHLVEAVDLAWRIQNLDVVLIALEQYALSAESSLAAGLHIRLMSAIDMLRRRHDLAARPEDIQEMESLVAHLREETDEATFMHEWQNGQSLSWENAVSLTLENER